jgi:Domain of unknown function (DUF4386)
VYKNQEAQYSASTVTRLPFLIGYLFIGGAGMTTLSKNARVAGLIYIVGSLVAVVRLIYIPSTLIVSENTTATVNNIARHELLFRFGILSQLLTGALWIFV